jgi:hypothetical protein
LLVVLWVQADPLQQPLPPAQTWPPKICKSLGYYGRLDLGDTPPNCHFLGPSLVNSLYEMKTLQDLVIYLHRACFSPVTTTWTAAIDAGFFAT